MALCRARDPAQSPVGEHGAVHVGESTGVVLTTGVLQLHLKVGAKKAVTCAPTKSDTLAAHQ